MLYRILITGCVLLWFSGHAAALSNGGVSGEIVCEGEYGGHLQGVTSNGKDAFFWVYTTTLVKTDFEGKVLAKAGALLHLGDPAFHEGKVYVPVCTSWDQETDDSRVYVYDADTLKITERIPLREVRYGAGGIAWFSGRFYVVGGAPPNSAENFVYEYDSGFRPIATHVIASGATSLGVQNICHWGGYFWLGCYGGVLLKLDEGLGLRSHCRFEAGYGLEGWDTSRVLLGSTASREEGKSKRWRGIVRIAEFEPRETPAGPIR